ncbi:MAG: hypothetical protein ACK5Q5_10160, partial [Planctomycetaceae bacterium]
MTQLSTSFRNRFTRVRRQRWAAELLTAAAWLILGETALISVIAGMDYVWEVERPVRLSLLLIGSLALLLLIGVRLAQRLIRCSPRGTAADVETQHPEFGQRVRTAIEFSHRSPEDLQRLGVSPLLLTALTDETEFNVLPGELEQVVPRRQTLLAGVTALVGIVALATSTSIDWEWSRAVRRACLSNRPFTQLIVQPGNASVEAGTGLAVHLTLQGRRREDLRIRSRPITSSASEWSEEQLGPAQDVSNATELRKYETRLVRIDEPIEYQVLAGPEESDIYRIDVRYPLQLRGVTANLTPPDYTGLAARSVSDGNIAALAGTVADIRVELDRVPQSAALSLTYIGPLPQDAQRVQSHPIVIDGKTVQFSLSLSHDLLWSLTAVASDGMSLPENAHRIRIQHDQPPKISFQAPDNELEVHTLAEIVMRARAADDYGLTRAGIVFQINNGEEHALIAQDFAAANSGDGNTQGLPTRATLEQVLPLEYFALTERDTVMYYAFAEDNAPDSPHRTESDWRFVDIRPFQMRFRRPDPKQPSGGEGGSRRALTSLEELIRRERYALNRTVKLDRREAGVSSAEASSIERLIDYQAEIGSLTRELAERLTRLMLVEEVDVLFQAETSMLGAIDTLSVGNFSAAILQEKDAHQYLVEARNRLIIQLANNPQLRRALAEFNSGVEERLRRERNLQLSDIILRRLRTLANNQQRTSREAAQLASDPGASPSLFPPDDQASEPSQEVKEAPTDRRIDPDDLERRQADDA